MVGMMDISYWGGLLGSAVIIAWLILGATRDGTGNPGLADEQGASSEVMAEDYGLLWLL